MKGSIASSSTLVLLYSLALGAIVLPGEAAAEYRDTSAGGACKPAFGASNKFLFNNTYLENIGTTDQYVVCHFTMDDFSPSPSNPVMLKMHFSAGQSDGTASCLVQYGYYWSGTHLSSSQGSNVALSAGQSGFVEFDESLLVRDDEYDTLTLNCKVPGSWRMGLIEYWT